MASFLIVDADRNHREAIAIALRLDGHLASCVPAAQEGEMRLLRGRYDCCVVDVHLPGADGLLEMADSLGVRSVVTGPYPELIAATAERHPHAGVLRKPFRARELAERLAGAA